MQKDGGVSEYTTNEAGAKYGTGYCDAQCPHDIKWIAGKANQEDWNPSPTDPNAGHGKYGTLAPRLQPSHRIACAPHSMQPYRPRRH